MMLRPIISSIFSMSASSSGATEAAGVVDEHGDARIVLQFCLHFRQVRLVVEVRHDGSDMPSAGGGEARSQRFEWRLAARHKDEIVSPFCETVCIDSSDAPRGAGYEGG